MDSIYNPSQGDLIIVSTPYVPGYKIVKVIGFTWGLIVRLERPWR